MNHVGVGAWLVLAAVAGLTVASLDAQEATSEQALSDRTRQIQGNASPETAQPSHPRAAGAPEQVERVQAVGDEAPSGATARASPGSSVARRCYGRRNRGGSVDLVG